MSAGTWLIAIVLSLFFLLPGALQNDGLFTKPSIIFRIRTMLCIPYLIHCTLSPSSALLRVVFLRKRHFWYPMNALVSHRLVKPFTLPFCVSSCMNHFY